jgi:2-(1,2-epoxy-1,2-dihydrophenyl)acetyl-CoA isomerase
MNYESILYQSANGIARITLNRPERLNSFTSAMHAELRVALDEVKRDAGVRVLLLTGAGRGFCAGQDLSDRAVAPGEAPVDLGQSIESNYRPLVLTLRNLPLPVVCAVNGVAAGAGANIALACDIVIATRSASFVQAFCKIGLIPDSGGTWFLPRLVGNARALGLAMFGDKLPAEQAAAWGLIWKCIDDAEFAASVEALLQQLAQAPTRGLAAIKRALQAADGNTLEAQLDLERDLQRELGTSADYREGVAAFLAKRAPRFTGR